MLRIFTLKFQSALGAFDDAELQAFIKDKEVVSIRDHFFTKDDMPYLTVLVTYQLAGPPTDVPAVESAAATSRNEKWREILEEGDWPLFNTLREWRNRLANEEGGAALCDRHQSTTRPHCPSASANPRTTGAHRRSGPSKAQTLRRGHP